MRMVYGLTSLEARCKCQTTEVAGLYQPPVMLTHVGIEFPGKESATQ